MFVITLKPLKGLNRGVLMKIGRLAKPSASLGSTMSRPVAHRDGLSIPGSASEATDVFAQLL
jgi:hypothetical protein